VTFGAIPLGAAIALQPFDESVLMRSPEILTQLWLMKILLGWLTSESAVVAQTQAEAAFNQHLRAARASAVKPLLPGDAKLQPAPKHDFVSWPVRVTTFPGSQTGELHRKHKILEF
jgi:hypothetical protein